MQKQIFKIIFSFAMFLMLPNFANAAPSINSATVDGVNLSITGENFGINQGVTAPIFWDNFDSGINGADLITQLAGSVPWTVNNAPTPIYSNNQAHSGNQSSYAQHSNGVHWSHFTVGERALPIPDSLAYYHTFWFRFNTPRPLGTVGETKLIRIFGSDPQQALPDRPFVKSGGVGDWWTTSYAKAYDGLEPYINWINQSPAENIWHRVEAIYRQSSAGGVADGSVQLILDGITQANYSNIITRADSANRWIKVDFFSGMTNWDTGNIGLTWEKWVDDAYLSTTWQRIELCGGETWLTRDHCELQTVTTWNAGGNYINTILNQGSFLDDSTAYVYVIDENGNVNADGYSMTLPGVLDVTSPAAPTGLGVI